MQEPSLFQGYRVKLGALSGKDAERFAEWSNDANFLRNFDSKFALPREIEYYSNLIEKNNEADNIIQFCIKTINCENLEDNDMIIGFALLNDIEWNNRSANLVLAIAENDFKNMGLGTETLQILLDFAFNELNLNRIGVSMISNNERALHLFEKSGFVIEGSMRQAVLRDGIKLDKIFMSILKAEWSTIQHQLKLEVEERALMEDYTDEKLPNPEH